MNLLLKPEAVPISVMRDTSRHAEQLLEAPGTASRAIGNLLLRVLEKENADWILLGPYFPICNTPQKVWLFCPSLQGLVIVTLLLRPNLTL